MDNAQGRSFGLSVIYLNAKSVETHSVDANVDAGYPFAAALSQEKMSRRRRGKK